MSFMTLFADDKQFPGRTLDFNLKTIGLPSFAQALGFTFTRNGSQRVLQDGQYVTLSANQFGTHYDAVTDKYWYLSELAATNLLTYSHDFSNALYTKTEVTVGASVDSPFGAGTGTRLVASTNNTQHYIMPTTLLPNSVLTTRYWIVKADYRYVGIGHNITDTSKLAVFDLQNGSLVQDLGVYSGRCGIIPVANGWHIIYVQHSSATATTRQPRLYILGDSYAAGVDGNTAAFAGDGTRGVYACHCQQETGDIPTSPIRTSGVTASRSATVLQTALSNIAGFNAAKYTLQVSFRLPVVGTRDRAMCSIFDGTNGNRLTIAVNSGAGMSYSVASGGAQVAGAVGPLPGTSVNKIAVSCEANMFLSSFNGVAGTADTSGAMPISPTTLNIGLGPTGSGQGVTLIGSVALITTNLTQSQINDITS